MFPLFCFSYIDIMFSVELRFGCILFERKLCLCEDKIELCHKLLICRKLTGVVTRKGAQLRKNHSDLLLLLKFKFSKAIVETHHRGRFYKKCRA